MIQVQGGGIFCIPDASDPQPATRNLLAIPVSALLYLLAYSCRPFRACLKKFTLHGISAVFPRVFRAIVIKSLPKPRRGNHV